MARHRTSFKLLGLTYACINVDGHPNGFCTALASGYESSWVSVKLLNIQVTPFALDFAMAVKLPIS